MTMTQTSKDISGGDNGPASEQMTRVLLVDDESFLWAPQLRRPFRAEGIELLTEIEAGKTLSRIEEDRPDALLLDVLFPDASGRQSARGRELLPQVVHAHPHLPVIMFTTTLADERMQLTASDFPGAAFLFSKSAFAEPSASPDAAAAALARVIKDLVIAAQEPATLDDRVGFLVGSSRQMRELAISLITVAATDVPVLLIGESGTGKELVAGSLQALSPRKDLPFLKLNCGAVTDETLESTLFGHERGAFTGASEAKAGLFESADKGTLLLDEVQTMSTRLQQSLLRVLQEGVIRRMGSNQERRIDVRVIAATNEDLEVRVRDGSFRSDLYYRLNRVKLRVPPLRERRDDIEALYGLFIRQASERLGKMVSTKCRGDLLQLLHSHTWPGNVRELQSAVETAVALSRANILTPDDFRAIIPQLGSQHLVDADAGDSATPLPLPVLNWAQLKNIKGPLRLELLRKYVEQQTHVLGRTPTSGDLALGLGTSPDNIRRVLSEAGISLRAMRLPDG